MVKKFLLTTPLAISLLKGTKPKQNKSGKKKARIVGLLVFADISSKIWASAQGGNIYAKYYLQDVSNKVKKCDLEIDKVTRLAQAILASVGPELSVVAGPARKVKPVQVSNRFANPYAVHMAHNLWRLDNLLKDLDRCLQAGYCSHADHDDVVSTLMRVTRGVFHAVVSWKAEIEVSRLDIQQKSPAYLKYRDTIDSLPPGTPLLYPVVRLKLESA